MPPAELGRLLGRLTLVSSVAAVGSGFVADAVVGATGSFASPFGLSAGCLVGAGVVIVVSWGENYGVEGVPGGGEEGRASLRAALVVLRKGKWRRPRGTTCRSRGAVGADDTCPMQIRCF